MAEDDDQPLDATTGEKAGEVVAIALNAVPIAIHSSPICRRMRRLDVGSAAPKSGETLWVNVFQATA